MKKILQTAGRLALISLVFGIFLIPGSVAAQEDSSTDLSVSYRAHVENYGNMPKPDGTVIEGPEAIGTRGQGLRVEGFWIKLTGDVPENAGISYQVHVQNEGWMEPVSNGEFTGTEGRGLRVESIKIWLDNLDGYDVYYRGHVQNIGNIPQNNSEWGWVKNGEELGTTGSCLRLEELQIKIVPKGTDLSAYNELVKKYDKLNKNDYTSTSWTNLQTVLSKNVMTSANSQAEVDQALVNIQAAINALENLTTSLVYDSAGTYGPSSGVDAVDRDVIIKANGVILQNMTISGNLIITEDVGDGNVTLNNITVLGDLRIRGGGENSIHINGGQYPNIKVEKTPTGIVRIVTTDLNGTEIIISEMAEGEEVILEGAFDQVTVDAPNAMVITRGNTTIESLDLGIAAVNATVNLGSNTNIAQLSIAGDDANINGTGTIKKADIKADGAVFEIRPGSWTEESGLDVPAVIPAAPTTGGGGTSKTSLTISDPTLTLSKVYDGTTSAVVTAGTLTGVAAGDNVSVTATAVYSDKTVGSGKTITVSYTLGGTDASKYNKPENYMSTSGAITKLQLMVESPTLTTSKIYDATTTASVTAGSLSNAVPGDVVSVSAAANYTDSTVATGKTITVVYTIDGPDSGNYIKPVDDTSVTSGEISKKQLTISAPSLTTTKIYDGNNTAAVTAGDLSGKVGSEVVSVTAVASYNSANAGNGKTITISYSISGTDSGNYLAPVNETSGGVITKKALTETDIVVSTSKIYDGTTNATISNEGIYSGKVGTDDVTVTPSATYASKTAESGKSITVSFDLSGGQKDNYSAPASYPYTTTGEITKLPLTIESPTLTTSKIYDATTTASVTAGSLSNAVPGDVVSVSAAANYTDSTVATAKTITVVYTIDGSDSGNYIKPVDDTSVTSGEISKKQLTISAPSLTTTKVYDGNSTAAVTAGDLSGKVGSEVVTVTAVASYDSANAGNGKTITVNYSISGGDNGNYLAPSSGTENGTITPKALTVSGVSVTTSKEYDGSISAAVTNAGTLNPSDVIGSDAVSLTSTTASYDSAVVGTGKTITVNYTLTNPNYTVQPFIYSTIGVIAPAATTVTDIRALSPDGAYKAGDTISIQVTFSNAVDVTGTPTLKLVTNTLNSDTSDAYYASRSGTTTLIFSYTVRSGDSSNDLGYQSTTALSGTIKDSATVDANLTLPALTSAGSLQYNSNIVLDTIAPVITANNETVALANLSTWTGTVSASDNIDGDISTSVETRYCQYYDIHNPPAEIPYLMNFDAAKTYIGDASTNTQFVIMYSATDNAGNTANKAVTITVDPTPPVITSVKVYDPEPFNSEYSFGTHIDQQVIIQFSEPMKNTAANLTAADLEDLLVFDAIITDGNNFSNDATTPPLNITFKDSTTLVITFTSNTTFVENPIWIDGSNLCYVSFGSIESGKLTDVGGNNCLGFSGGGSLIIGKAASSY
ncbi:YDG domain-containing protein [Acetobacterium woodii]|nr:YDG domain-containing protein [Acetobacterium woodii]